MAVSSYCKLLLILSFFTFFVFADVVYVNAALPLFREAPAFQNGVECLNKEWFSSTIHIAMTLDETYLRGSIAGVHSVLKHASCPENLVFHFIATHTGKEELRRVIRTTFPSLKYHLYYFDSRTVIDKISSSVRQDLDQPLNYARIYLADLLPISVKRIIYFDSDLIIVDDVSKLWNIDLGDRVLGAPEYCHANFTHYFTSNFWSNRSFVSAFGARKPCYFNTGVMVINLLKWREGSYTDSLEYWMEVQKIFRIYELGSLPPFLLVFAGNIVKIDDRWNQHGLGGDNTAGRCRDLHPGPVSLLHWSGKGKPWLRLDGKRPCPLDQVWAPYDLMVKDSSYLFSDL